MSVSEFTEKIDSSAPLTLKTPLRHATLFTTRKGVPHLHPIILPLVPCPFLGRDNLLTPQSDQFPDQDRDGVNPPPPRTGYAGTGYAAGGTPLAVSRRRTFLFEF